MLSRRTILLKPMQPSANGYMRLQSDGRLTLLQLHARGLEAGENVRLYAYLRGQHAQEIAQGAVNAHGELSAEHEEEALSNKLLAVILISSGDQPRPLLVGLCAPPDDVNLMDAKNAALALCERLKDSQRPPAQPAANEKTAVFAPEAKLPREVFLPAIDPAPYAQAEEPTPAEQPLPSVRSAPPVGRLRPLKWPRGFESLKPYFDKALPTAVFDLPGWRFVYTAHAGGPNGLWIGIQPLDGCVCGVAYAHRGTHPPAEGKGYRAMRGLDGQMYQTLWQNVSVRVCGCGNG